MGRSQQRCGQEKQRLPAHSAPSARRSGYWPCAIFGAPLPEVHPSGLIRGASRVPRPVEVLLEGTLSAADHHENIGDSTFDTFFHNILDGRSIDDREHFLWHGLGGGEKPRAKSGSRNNSFCDRHWSGVKGKDSPRLPSGSIGELHDDRGEEELGEGVLVREGRTIKGSPAQSWV